MGFDRKKEWMRMDGYYNATQNVGNDPHVPLDPNYHPLAQPGKCKRPWIFTPLYYLPQRLRMPVLYSGFLFLTYQLRASIWCGPPRDENNVRIPVHDPEFVDAFVDYHYRLNYNAYTWGMVYKCRHDERMRQAGLDPRTGEPLAM